MTRASRHPLDAIGRSPVDHALLSTDTLLYIAGIVLAQRIRKVTATWETPGSLMQIGQRIHRGIALQDAQVIRRAVLHIPHTVAGTESYGLLRAKPLSFPPPCQLFAVLPPSLYPSLRSQPLI
jgi:hypothetical protein